MNQHPIVNRCKKIETIEFAASLGYANDLDQFIRGVWAKPDVNDLVVGRRYNATGQNYLLARIAFLLSEEYDVKYPRSSDTAIAVYLLVLDKIGEPTTWSMARQITDLPGFFWARRVADKIVNLEMNSFVDKKVKPEHLISMSIGKHVVTFDFLWYDIWVGVFVDRDKKKVYVCPLPMCVLCVSF